MHKFGMTLATLQTTQRWLRVGFLGGVLALVASVTLASVTDFVPFKQGERKFAIEMNSMLSAQKPLAPIDVAGFRYDQDVLYGSPSPGWLGAYRMADGVWLWWLLEYCS